MIPELYYRLHRLFSKSGERGEYSAGVWQNMIRAEAMKFIPGPGGKVLDLGCGEGLFLAQISEGSSDIGLWGADNSPERISQAQKRLAGKNVHLSVEDATSLSFNDRFFDTVVCVNVFFNMPSIEVVKDTLRQMKRVARDEGRLVFDFRNSRNPLLALKYKLAPFYDRTVRGLPLKTYSIEQINGILKELGLKVVSKNYFGAFFKRWAPIILVEARKI